LLLILLAATMPLLASCGKKPRETPTATLLLMPPMSREVKDADIKSFEIFKVTQSYLLRDRKVLAAAIADEEIKDLGILEGHGDPVTWLAKELRVEYPDNGLVMTVSLRGGDPSEAAAVVNAVVEAYLRDIVEAKLKLRDERIEIFERTAVAKEKELMRARQSLGEMAREIKTTANSEVIAYKAKVALEEHTVTLRDLSELRREWRNAKTELKVLQVDAKSPDAAVKMKQQELRIVAAEEAVKEREILAEDEEQAMQRFGQAALEIETLQGQVKQLETALGQMIPELERMKIDLSSPPCIKLLEKARAPGELQ
jgi:polysaccharide biosynthesis transport protein